MSSTIKYILVSLALSSIASLGYAAPLPPGAIQQANTEADRVQREQNQRIEQDRLEVEKNRPRSSIEVVPPTPTEDKAKTGCRNITEIQFLSAPLLNEEARQQISAPFLNTCMTVFDIERLLAEVTKYYIDKGYITTRAYIQPQDLVRGVLTILVVEGTTEKLMLDDTGAGSENINLTTVFPGLVGKVLNLRDIEQGLDQINRLSSNKATMAIAPGEQAGGSTVVIKNTPTDRLFANVTLDNLGSTSTGEHQLGISMTAENPLQLNDSFNFTHRRTTESDYAGKHSHSNSLLYSIPYGYLTFSAAHTWSDYATTLSLTGGDLISTGESSSTSFTTDYVAYRDAVNRVNLSADLTAKSSDNYLAGQLLEVSSRNLALLNIGANWSTKLFDGALTTGIKQTWGLDAFDALVDANNLTADAPRAQFSKITLSLNWNRPFKIGNQNFNFNTAFSGQHARDVLYGSEQISIGGPFSVRGFRNTSIAGDDGFYLRNDLSMAMQKNLFGTNVFLKPFIGFDVGHIHDHYGQVGGGLSGGTVGLYASAKNFSLDITGSQAITLPSSLEDESFHIFIKLSVKI